MEKDPEGGTKKVANWHKTAASILSNPAKFLTDLMDYDKDNIPEAVIKKITPLIENESFTPAVIAKVSKACTAMCTWVHAMNTYVEPSLTCVMTLCAFYYCLWIFYY